MWDRLLTDCHVATMVAQPGNPLGLFPNAAIGIADGKIVRVGKRTELAGFRAKEVTPCGGAWVTPGLVDCHTHLVFGGTRANEHAMRRAGATYEEIAQAGGGIASTVAATKAASADELRETARRRLHALMAGGVTTIEIKSGYGLDTASEIRLLNAARAIGRDEPVRIVTTLLAAHALPPEAKEGPARDAYVKMIAEEMIPAVAKAGLATSVDAFCETIAFTPAEVERVFTAARANGLPVRLHAEQLSNQNGAALAASYKALSADHLEHLDAARRQGDGRGGDGRGAAPRRLLRAQRKEEAAGRPAARRRRPDRHRQRLQPRHLAAAEPAAGDEHGLHPVRPDPGGSDRRHDHQRRPRPRPRP